MKSTIEIEFYIILLYIDKAYFIIYVLVFNFFNNRYSI